MRMRSDVIELLGSEEFQILLKFDIELQYMLSFVLKSCLFCSEKVSQSQNELHDS